LQTEFVVAKNRPTGRIGTAFCNNPVNVRPTHLLLLSALAGLCWLPVGRIEAQTPPAATADDALHLPEVVLPGLQPLINDALEASSRVLQARLAVLIAEAGAQDAKSGLYQHISASAEVDGRQEFRQDLPGVHYSDSIVYSIGTVQPLYHWNALVNRARIGEIQQELSDHEMAEARRNLVVEMRQQYTGLILRALDLKQARWDDARRTKQLQRDEDRAAHGEVPTFDLSDERLAVEQSHLVVERLELAWDRAQADFAVLVGVTTFGADHLPTEIPAVPDWSARLQPATPAVASVSSAPAPAALETLVKAREVARLTYEIERVRLRPTLDLVAGLSENLVSYTANTAQTFGADIQYVGLRVNWNIFDGYQSQAAVARARADLRQKDLDYDLAAQALQRQLTEGWRDLALAQRELAVMEARYAQTGARLAADQPRKDAGQIADEEWQQRLFDHEQVHLDLLRARAAQLLRIADYALLSERSTLPADRVHFP